MKIKRFFICAVAAAMCLIGASALADNKISVYLDNVEVEMDQEPVIINSRTMVPIRAVFEKAGSKIDWDDATKTAVIQRGENTVVIQFGQPYIYKNSVPVSLDVPSTIVNDRIVIPVRAIAEAMDFGVTWNSISRTVLISTSGKAYRANGQWKTGFRDTDSEGVLLSYGFENLQLDLDGDGSLDLISFTPAGNGNGAVLKVNNSDYSSMLPVSSSGVVNIGFVDICSGDKTREIVAIESGSVKKAWFFRYNGQELIALKSNGSDDGSITFIQKLFFDGIENIISDRDGMCFINPMLCTSMYSLEDSEIKRYSLDPKNMEGVTVQAIFDDAMTYNVKYTNTYNKGKYIDGTEKADGVLKTGELPHNTMTVAGVYYDSIDPSKFELYVTFANGVNAVIWPYNA